VRAAVVLCALTLVLGATACGERSEPTGATVPLFPVTVKRSGATPIVLQKQPARVAAVTPAAISVVAALEAAAGGKHPILLDLSSEVDLPGLRRFKPDLIVASNEADPRELEQAARATKAPVYTLPQDSIRDVFGGVTDLGALLGRELEARKLDSDIAAKVHFVRMRVASAKKVSVFVDTGLYVTVATNSLIGDLLREAGGESVAGAAPGPEPFDLTRLRKLNPDFYLATSDSGTTLRDLRKSPSTRGLKAVREGHFAIVRASLIEPGPRLGDGLVAIARLLHPDAFR
jgi:iron complex transport system substrate-binding protein